MFKRTAAILLLICISSLAACGRQEDKSLSISKDSIGYPFLREQIPGFDNILGVYIGLDRLPIQVVGDYLSVAVPRVEEQQMLMDILLNTNYENGERTDQAVSFMTLRFAYDERNVDINLGQTEDRDIISFYTLDRNAGDLETAMADMTESHFSFPKGTVDIDKIKEICNTVRQDKEDPEYTGVIYKTDNKKASVKMIKSQSFYLRDILDGTAEISGSASSPVPFETDTVFEFLNAVYVIDLESGNFSRNEGGSSVYGALDSQFMMKIKMIFGALN